METRELRQGGERTCVTFVTEVQNSKNSIDFDLTVPPGSNVASWQCRNHIIGNCVYEICNRWESLYLWCL